MTFRKTDREDLWNRLPRLLTTLALLCCCATAVTAQANADFVKGCGKYLGGVLKNQGEGYAQAVVRNQVPGQQQDASVGNPIKYVANQLSPKDTIDILTQDNGYRHSSMEFLYRTAAADDYMGQFVPGGDSVIQSGAIKNAMENQYVTEFLNNPELDNMPGPKSADTLVDYTNDTTCRGMYFYMTLDQNEDYKDKNVLERGAYLIGDTICGTFQNIENLGKAAGKAWDQLMYDFNHQSDVDDETKHTWLLRLITGETANQKQTVCMNVPVDDATGSKKPNIYLYGEAGQEVRVAFAAPERLTAAAPDYPSCGWNVVLNGAGRLTVADAAASDDFSLTGRYGLGGDVAAADGTLGYLFYESETDGGAFRYEQAWTIEAQGRREALYDLLTAYGFNEAEATDFADFWDGFLHSDADYLFYPQTTELVDAQMPLRVTPQPEHVFRLWFVVQEYEPGATRPAVPRIAEMAVHDGYALTEWGVVFRSESEYRAAERAFWR